MSPVADSSAVFFPQILNQEPKPLIQIEFFEEFLAPRGFADEGGGNEIGEHFRVRHFVQVAIDLLRKIATAGLQPGIKFQHLGREGIGLNRQAGVSFERLDSSNWKRRFLFELTESYLRIPCRMRSEVPSLRPTQARMRPTVLISKKSSLVCQL